jgi:hypothetical protein
MFHSGERLPEVTQSQNLVMQVSQLMKAKDIRRLCVEVRRDFMLLNRLDFEIELAIYRKNKKAADARTSTAKHFTKAL